MGLYNFTATDTGVLCSYGLASNLAVKRKNPSGDFVATQLDGKTIVAVNGCITIPMSGEYEIEWSDAVDCCGTSQSPVFEFSQVGGCDSALDDVITALEDINQSVDDSEIANNEDREIIKTALANIEVAITNGDASVVVAIEQLEAFLQEIDDNTDGIEAALAALIALQTVANEPQSDFEQVRVCRSGTIHIVTTEIESNGTLTEISAVDTLESCEGEIATAEHTISSGTGAIPAGLHSVAITNITGTTSIEGYSLKCGASVFITGQEHGVNGTLPAITPVGGTWEWLSLDKL